MSYDRLFKLILTSLAMLLVAVPANAQRQANSNDVQAPARFKKFEFPNGRKGIYPYGDTIILRGLEDFEVTLNGGKSWSIYPRDSSKVVYAHQNFPVFYYSEIRASWGKEDSIAQIFISTDFGKTFEERSVPKDIIGKLRSRNFDIGGFFLGEGDPNDIFLVCFTPPIMAHATVLLRSRDAGKTWFFQDIPTPSDGFGNQFHITFNHRFPERWYIWVSATYHGWNNDFYVTHDDGDSFERIWNYSELMGIGHEDEVRVWNVNERVAPVYLSRGFAISNIYESGWLEHRDWLSAIDLDDCVDTGLNRCRFSRIGYQPWRHEPTTAIISAEKYTVDSAGYYVSKNWNGVYLTKDDGRSFELLWGDTTILGALIDPVHAKVWVFHNSPLTGSTVWYTSIDAASQVQVYATGNAENVKLYPNPSSDHVNIELADRYSGILQIEIIDCSGRSAAKLRGISHDGIVRLALPGLSSGLYQVLLKSPDGVFTQTLRIIQ